MHAPLLGVELLAAGLQGRIHLRFPGLDGLLEGTQPLLAVELRQWLLRGLAAIQADPNYANAFNNRGLLWKAMGDAKGAEAAFKVADKLGKQQGR